MFAPSGDLCLTWMKGEAKKAVPTEFSMLCLIIIIVASIHRILLLNVFKSNKTMSQKLVKRMISNLSKAGGLI